MVGGRRRTVAIVLVSLAMLVTATAAGWAYYLNHQIDDVRRISVDFGQERKSHVTAPDDDAPRGRGDGAAPKDGPSSGREDVDSSSPDSTGDETGGAEEKEPPANEPLTILVAGVDAGAGPRIADALAAGSWTPGRYRSDTLMLLHLPADRRSATVVSVPRDSWVEIPGHGTRKVNAAFSLGGPDLLVSTVERLTRVDVDHMMIIDWQAFIRITTAIGGVRVEIPEDVYDWKQDVHWKAGTHRLEGERALQYVRQRYGLPRGDFHRIDRQQNFVRATLSKVLADETLLNPVKVTRILEAVGDHFLVDDGLSSERLRALALSSRQLRGGAVEFVTIPTTGIENVQGNSVVRVDKAGTRRLLQAVTEARTEQYLQRNDTDRLDDPGEIR